MGVIFMALLPDIGTSKANNVSDTSTQPNKTYKMLIDDNKIMGHTTNDIEAVEQACYKVLNTERYKHVIYSWNYGVELNSLFGKPMPYVLSEIPRRISEALLQDDRINDITDFDLSYDKKGNVLAKFTVKTNYGDISISKEVNVS